MKLELTFLDPSVKKFRSLLVSKTKWLEGVLRGTGEIEIYIVSSPRMHRLNKQFLKKDRATNVLSFPKPRNFPGSKLGEVYLDPRYIAAHKEDLQLMLVHGILHILGYDHMRKNDRIKMEKKERALLKDLRHVA